jgi:hypothetical protein
VIRVAEVLRGRRDLPPEVVEDEHQSGRQRAMQGIPGEDVVAAYRLVMAVVRDAFLESAMDSGVHFETVLRGTRQLWELTDSLSNELIAVRRHIDSEIARREEQQRQTFLHRVLLGSLSAAEITQIGSAYNVLPDRDYWVLRARVAPDALPATIRLVEQFAVGRGVHAVAGPIDGDVGAIVSARPALPGLDGVGAMSGPVHAHSLSQAFAEATRLLNVAVRFRRTGLVDQSALSIRIAVVQQDELGEALYARYVAPVLAEVALAEQLLDTIAVFVEANCNIARGAAELCIHQNTLRNRVERFEEVTGTSLKTLETVFEVWWALQYWALRRSGA